MRVDDPTLFAKTEGRTLHCLSDSIEIPLLDPFKTPIKTLPVFSITGDQLSQSITLNNRVFGMPLREDILHRVVVWQVTSVRWFVMPSLLKDVKEHTVLKRCRK